MLHVFLATYTSESRGEDAPLPGPPISCTFNGLYQDRFPTQSPVASAHDANEVEAHSMETGRPIEVVYHVSFNPDKEEYIIK